MEELLELVENNYLKELIRVYKIITMTTPKQLILSMLDYKVFVHKETTFHKNETFTVESKAFKLMKIIKEHILEILIQEIEKEAHNCIGELAEELQNLNKLENQPSTDMEFVDDEPPYTHDD